jgi:hypothetical protein
MFGEDGWCRSCGVPRHGQLGNLVLQREGFKRVEGAWMPNWRFDVICLERELAERIADRFRVELRDVEWRGNAPGEAKQTVAPTVGEAWFDREALHERLVAVHRSAGALCPECRVWRWMPLSFSPVPPLTNEVLPPLLDVPGLENVDAAASPEWFGDGLNAFRQIVVRRELAEIWWRPARATSASKRSLDGCQLRPVMWLSPVPRSIGATSCGPTARLCCR